ncbi:MAG: pantoate--beta-alanine ligase [Taibaiella sp.]|nr:pantoate--beta-alanine ligase [Taibaiella sp.]
MVILKRVKDIQEYLDSKRLAGVQIGFVPTMGALHDGHISLVQKCNDDGMLSVCSIFLNPTQFNDKSDLAKYPVSIDGDIELLLRAGCHVLFLPDVEDIYPDGEAQMPTFDFGYLENILEGASRPGHFKGVGQVVARLLSIVQPHNLYLGRKDYQQCLVIRRLIDILGLNETKVIICPTRREPDGLAMSSRNRRLTEPQRTIAGTIYQCLVSMQTKSESGKFALVRKECEELLVAKGFVPEYIALANARDLSLLEDYTSTVPMIALITARIGNIRLIDNMLIGN